MNWWKENKLQRRIYVCAAALTAAAFGWYALTRAGSLAGLVAAGLSCLLFALCLLRGVDHALCFFTAEPLPSPDARLGRRSLRRDKRHPWERIVLFMLITRLFLFAVGYAFHAAGGVYEGGIWDTLRACWLKSDSPSYLGIAENWYVTEGDPRFHIVFFPLYPICIRALNFLTGNSFVSAMLVSSFCAIAAAILMYELAALDYEREAALRAVKFLFLTPAAFFFAAPMTESLFLLVTVRYVLAWDRRQWGRCAVLGVLAGLCRAPGGLLLGLAALELAAAWRRGKRPALASILAMLAPAAGLGLYFGLNQAVYGRWNQYSVYQWEHWGQKLGLFTDTVRYHLDYMASWWEDNRKAAVGICLAAILCILLALGLLAASVRRLPAAWLGFGLAYLAVTMGATWLLSAPRYAVGLFCLPVALALLLQDRPRLTCGVLAVQVMVSVVYTWQYLHGWPIY
mgnify:CR=1 FL=1